VTPRTLRVLEFSAVCGRLAGLCASALGREAALARAHGYAAAADSLLARSPVGP